MSKTQTVQQLLDQFDVDLNLPSEVLDLEIKGDFDSFEIIHQTLSCLNSSGLHDYGSFRCYHFENDEYYCTIVPDNNLRTVMMAEKIDSNWYRVCFDKFGRLSFRS